MLCHIVHHIFFLKLFHILECPDEVGHLEGETYTLGNVDNPCLIMVNNTFPCNGKIKAWAYRLGANYNDSFAYAAVWKPRSSSTNDGYTLIHKTKLALNKQ